MALEMEMTLDSGVVLTAAYIDIATFVYTFDRLNPTIVMNLDIFADATAYSEGKTRLEYRTHAIVGDEIEDYFGRSVLQVVGVDFIIKAHDWLLAQDAYATAVVV